MASYEIIITPLAERDMRDIASFIVKEQLEPIEVAEAVLTRIDEAIYRLCEHPNRFEMVHNARYTKSGLHKLPVQSHIILYTVDESTHAVTIIRIIHSRQDWINLI